MRPLGEFGPTLEQGSLTSESAWLTGPLQNLNTINKAPSKDGDQPILIPFEANLIAAQSQTFFCESGIPDYWIATVRPATGVKISIFPSLHNSGVPIRLSGGGYLRLPGLSEYF